VASWIGRHGVELLGGVMLRKLFLEGPELWGVCRHCRAACRFDAASGTWLSEGQSAWFPRCAKYRVAGRRFHEPIDWRTGELLPGRMPAGPPLQPAVRTHGRTRSALAEARPAGRPDPRLTSE
jgi:hypothetical protein